MIELRGAGRTRQGDAQVLPVALDRHSQLLERRSQHVLDEHDVGAGRHDYALGCDRAVADVGRVFVQQRHRRHQLAQQAERGVDVERDVVLLREFEEPERRTPVVASETSASVDPESFSRSTVRTWA